MSKKVTIQEIKNTVKDIADMLDNDLFKIKTREDLLSSFFYFDFNYNYGSDYKRLYEFVRSLSSFEKSAQRWESKNYGSACCMDRVIGYYSYPLCKKFLNITGVNYENRK